MITQYICIRGCENEPNSELNTILETRPQAKPSNHHGKELECCRASSQNKRTMNSKGIIICWWEKASADTKAQRNGII